MIQYGTFVNGSVKETVFNVSGSTISLRHFGLSSPVIPSFSPLKPDVYVKILLENGFSPINERFEGDVYRIINESKTVIDKMEANKDAKKYID